MKNKLVPINSGWLALAMLVIFLAHLPFALFTSEFQDGWIHALLYEQGAYEEIFKRLRENGRPIAGWLNLHAMTLTGSAHGAIWLSVLGAVTAGAAWYATFMRTGFISPKLAFVMAVLSAVTPANQIILSTPTVIFVSAHAFFALGIWFFVEAHLRQRTALGVVAYLLACVFGTLSALLGEATAPMLLLYPMVTLLVDGALDKSTIPKWRHICTTLMKRSAPFVIGAGAFATMFIMFPPVGTEMISERRLSFQPSQLMLSLATFIATIFMAWLPLWLAIGFLRNRVKKPAGYPSGSFDYRRHFLLLLAFSTAVFTLSPYVAALRLASPAGWGLRYLYYFGSALAWLLAYLVTTQDSHGRISVSGQVAGWLTIAIVAGLLMRWPLFAVRTIHEEMVVQSISASPMARQTKVIVINDKTDVMAAPLRDVEWTGLLQKAMDAPRNVIGIASPLEPESTWTRWRFQLRQRMGWAPAVQPVLTSGYLREHIRGLQGHAMVGHINSACDVSQVNIAEPSSSWFMQALGWYFKSTWNSSAYSDWQAAQAADRITIEKMPLSLDPCS
ncbi:MAG: hypothetical protein V4718_06275 [Pseudomonadota bacterium]